MADKFSISPTEIHRLQGQISRLEPDFVSVEEPLEIQLLTEESQEPLPISVTMRTPGNDDALGVGFLFTEGIIRERADIHSIYSPDRSLGNSLVIQLKPHVSVDLGRLERHFYTTSSCGVCGKASLEAVQQQCQIELPKTLWKVLPSTIYSLPDSLRAQQANFQQTGSIHGCALFDLSGNLIFSAEDVGRHNALDKLIGYFLLSAQSEQYTTLKKNTFQNVTFGEPEITTRTAATVPSIPLSEHILLLSGRISFELVQKAAMAGIRFIAAVGAPSSLAIDLAEDMGITLVGFLRGDKCNIYTHPHRINVNPT